MSRNTPMQSVIKLLEIRLADLKEAKKNKLATGISYDIKATLKDYAEEIKQFKVAISVLKQFKSE